MRAYGAVAVALAVFWLAFALYDVHGSMPPNPLRLPFERALGVSRIAPQGWAFFTRDPREPKFEAFLRRGDRWVRAPVGPNRRFLFGVSRLGRARGIEWGLVAFPLAGTDWRTCRVPVAECLDGSGTARHLRNRSPSPVLCGEVGLVRRAITPWAFASARRPVRLPYEAVRLTVSC